MAYYERDYVNEGYDLDDTTGPNNCIACGEILSEIPTGYEKVQDRIIATDEFGAPTEWSWTDEPVYKCTSCGREHSIDEVYR
jgi:hypothetical protein